MVYSFLIIDITVKFISQEHVSRLMKDNNSKFPSKYPSQSLESLQVCSSMLSFFLCSDKFKIHNTHQREIKNLLKTNSK